MKIDEKHIKTIKIFNATYMRACYHHKRKIRKKNYARARYMLRRGNQISRKEWKKYFPENDMKYKVSLLFTFIADEQEYYDSLIEEGYLPDEAERHIKNSLYEMADKIDGYADNIIYFPYMNECEIEEIEENNKEIK